MSATSILTPVGLALRSFLFKASDDIEVRSHLKADSASALADVDLPQVVKSALVTRKPKAVRSALYATSTEPSTTVTMATFVQLPTIVVV